MSCLADALDVPRGAVAHKKFQVSFLTRQVVLSACGPQENSSLSVDAPSCGVLKKGQLKPDGTQPCQPPSSVVLVLFFFFLFLSDCFVSGVV